jgi:hypothetical protein
MVPQNIRFIYHMTAIDNLPSILESGLYSHNQAHQLKIIERDISDPKVQDIRASVRDPIHNRELHDYVPLYFNPRNPMLYRRKDIQNEIVILGIESMILHDENTIFSDGNAASKETKFYNDVSRLDQVCWDIVNAKSWTDIADGKRIKCAEILVYPNIEIRKIKHIYCYSTNQRLQCQEIVKNLSKMISIGISVKQDLFFITE